MLVVCESGKSGKYIYIYTRLRGRGDAGWSISPNYFLFFSPSDLDGGGIR